MMPYTHEHTRRRERKPDSGYPSNACQRFLFRERSRTVSHVHRRTIPFARHLPPVRLLQNLTRMQRINPYACTIAALEHPPNLLHPPSVRPRHRKFKLASLSGCVQTALVATASALVTAHW